MDDRTLYQTVLGLQSPWEVSRVELDARRSGCACMPDRFTPHEIGEDYVLGVLLDEHDVEYVARYRLLRAQ